MKDYHQNHLCQQSESELKRNRIKNYDKDEIYCKCASPFTNLHCHECPLANKFCPVHRLSFHYDTKDKAPTEQEHMVISFHPSKKTDRFLQPIKSILANNCDSETKINFQYFSPKNLNTVMLKNRQIQTNLEDLKTSSGGGYFVEKTKSYVTGKTNKMKKLKQCFYSPCNSIVEKTRSQTCLKEEMQTCFASPKGFVWGSKSQEDKKPSSNVFLYCCDNLASSDADKSGVSDSDYQAVTGNLKPNNASEKVCQINQSRNTMPFCKSKGNQTQFLYFSTVEGEKKKTDSPRRVKKGKDNENPDHDSKLTEKESPKKETKESEESSSEKFQSDSSRSVYFTPFILVPKGAEKSDGDSEPKPDSESLKADKEVQSDGKPDEENRPLFLSTCSSPFIVIKEDSFGEGPKSKIKQKSSISLEEEKQAPPKMSSKSPSQTSIELSKADFKSLVLEVVKEIKYSESSEAKDKFTQYPSPSLSSTFHVIKKEETGVTSEENFNYLDIGYNNKFVQTENDYHGSSNSTQTSQSVGVCTCDTLLDFQHFKEEKFETKHETCQTDFKVLKDVEVEAIELKTNRSQMATPLVSVMSVQTQENKIDMWTQTEDFFQVPEFIDLTNSGSSNLTYVKKSFMSQDSDPGLEKLPELWCPKFHSDGELYNKIKCECIGTENEIPLSHICKCVRKEPSSDFVDNHEMTKPINVIFDLKATTEADVKSQQMNVTETKKIDTKEDGINTSFSDLSELRKIINDHFDKMLEEALKIPTSCFDRGVQTENPVSVRIENTKLLDAGAQTSACLIQPTPTPVFVTKTNLLCTKCTKEVSTLVNVGTSTDDTLIIKKRIDAESYCELTEMKTVKKVENTKQSHTTEKRVDTTTRKSSIRPLQPSPQKPVKKDLCKNEKPVPAPRKSITYKPNCSKTENLQPRTRLSHKVDTLEQLKKPATHETKPKTVNFNLISQKSQVNTLTKSTFQSDCVCEPISKPSTSRYSGKGNTAPGKFTRKIDTPVVSKTKPKPKTDHITYPVVIKPVWPRNIVECLQEKNISENESLPEGSSSSGKRNLSSDNDTETPTGKKIRNDNVRSVNVNSNLEKCFVFGKTQPKQQNESYSLRKDTGFVWVPSVSAPQFHSNEESTCSCGRALKSEEQLKRNPTFKAVPSVDFGNLFTVKSFHHTNINSLNEEPIRKLFECSFCKSLTYLKPRRLCDSNPRRSVEIARTFLQRKNDYQTESFEEELLKEDSLLSDRSELSKTSLQIENLDYEHLTNDSLYLCEQHDQETWTENVHDELDNESEENIASD